MIDAKTTNLPLLDTSSEPHGLYHDHEAFLLSAIKKEFVANEK